MLGSPSACLPNSVTSLLASPDFRCSFVPDGSGPGAAATAAAAASMGGMGLPLFGLPLHIPSLTTRPVPVSQGGSSHVPGQAPSPLLPLLGPHQHLLAPTPPYKQQGPHQQLPASAGGPALPGQPLLSQPLPLPRFGWVAVQPQGAAPAVPGERGCQLCKRGLTLCFICRVVLDSCSSPPFDSP